MIGEECPIALTVYVVWIEEIYAYTGEVFATKDAALKSVSKYAFPDDDSCYRIEARVVKR